MPDRRRSAAEPSVRHRTRLVRPGVAPFHFIILIRGAVLSRSIPRPWTRSPRRSSNLLLWTSSVWFVRRVESASSEIAPRGPRRASLGTFFDDPSAVAKGSSRKLKRTGPTGSLSSTTRVHLPWSSSLMVVSAAITLIVSFVIVAPFPPWVRIAGRRGIIVPGRTPRRSCRRGTRPAPAGASRPPPLCRLCPRRVPS
ncbi:MAG: hypothetical protein JWR07_1562 [Nevskia sp.]|nr:hypothetical protein [Nevskia sp.]